MGPVQLSLIFVLLLQSIPMPERAALPDPVQGFEMPRNLQRDYTRLWERFLTGREDARVLQDADRLLRRDSDLRPALIVQAWVHLYQGRVADAERKLDQVLQTAPDHSIALYYLAELAFAGQEYARATDLYARLLEMDPSRLTELGPKREKTLLLAIESLLRRAANAEADGRLDEAVFLYEQALQIAPREPTLHARLALVLGKQEQWGQALSHFELAGPAEDVQRHIAEALMHLGRADEARDILNSLAASGGPSDELNATIRELENLGRWGEDIELFQAIRSSDAITREQFAAAVMRYFPQIREFPRSLEIVTDIQTSVARDEIQSVLGVGLIEPLPNHTFDPSAEVSRGELAAALAHLAGMLGIAAGGAPPIPVLDVMPEIELHGDVQFVLNRGLMTLDESGAFNPSGTVSGEQTLRALDALQ